MGRRQFALTMFYGGHSEGTIDGELWFRDLRVPLAHHLWGVVSILVSYGLIAVLVWKVFF